MIKNSVEQGRQAVVTLTKGINKSIKAQFDLIIVGAGSTGISASLTAKRHNTSTLILEQDALGGTVFTFPRAKIVMTSSMDLPLYGKVRLNETSKSELLNLWNEVLSKNSITIRENTKVESISTLDKHFVVKTLLGEEYTSRKVLLAIGRRGTPRKLNVPGEVKTKVAYRLLEPELISEKEILVVGGGDSAIETALLLFENNNVTLSYRGEVFGRLKSKNNENIKAAITDGKINVLFSSVVTSIEDDVVKIAVKDPNQEMILKNDLVYIFAGGELPTQFLEKIGIQTKTKYGEAILKHET